MCPNACKPCVRSGQFDDDHFDVAYCNGVPIHVPDTHTVLREAKRVLKPGGLIASREMISSSSFTHPDFGVLRKAWDMFEDLLAADDGHPQMGKDMKAHFVKAGFADIWTSAAFEAFTTPEEVAFIHQIAQQWFLSPEITEAAIKYGPRPRISATPSASPTTGGRAIPAPLPP